MGGQASSLVIGCLPFRAVCPRGRWQTFERSHLRSTRGAFLSSTRRGSYGGHRVASIVRASDAEADGRTPCLFPRVPPVNGGGCSKTTEASFTPCLSARVADASWPVEARKRRRLRHRRQPDGVFRRLVRRGRTNGRRRSRDKWGVGDG